MDPEQYNPFAYLYPYTIATERIEIVNTGERSEVDYLDLDGDGEADLTRTYPFNYPSKGGDPVTYALIDPDIKMDLNHDGKVEAQGKLVLIRDKDGNCTGFRVSDFSADTDQNGRVEMTFDSWTNDRATQTLKGLQVDPDEDGDIDFGNDYIHVSANGIGAGEWTIKPEILDSAYRDVTLYYGYLLPATGQGFLGELNKFASEKGASQENFQEFVRTAEKYGLVLDLIGTDGKTFGSGEFSFEDDENKTPIIVKTDKYGRNIPHMHPGQLWGLSSKEVYESMERAQQARQSTLEGEINYDDNKIDGYDEEYN